MVKMYIYTTFIEIVLILVLILNRTETLNY